jgi:outer membrane lipoprotein-sorting protein
MKRVRFLLAAFAVALGSTTAAEGPGAAPAVGRLTLEQLMRGMAGTKGVVAHFRERKDLALLEVPLETRGTIYFIPPDRLARHTTSPSVTDLVIDGDHFRFRDRAGGDDVDLSQSPVARQLVENFIVLFNGDLEALRERYEVDFHADGDRWELGLTPRHAPLKNLIRSFTLRGSGRALREMVMVETDGDRTTTTFDRVETDHAFGPDEIRRLFAAPASNGSR